jgi:hypothetical protein
MNIMVVSMKVDDARSEEVDQHLRDDVAPWAKRQPGFVSGQWLRLAGGDQAMGLVVFESEEQANAAARGPRSQPSVDGRAWNTEGVDVFEVVAQA